MPSDVYTRWYLCDEVGLSISHSNSPNIRSCPFYVQIDGQESYTISILWPITDIEEGEILYRDYMFGIESEVLRSIQSLAFKYQHQLSTIIFDKYMDNVDINFKIPEILSINNEQSIETPESWEILENKLKSINSIKIFCDRVDHLNSDYITQPDIIQLVNNPHDADVLYLIDHTFGNNNEEYNKTNKMTSQFWWNGMIISKSSLVQTIKAAQNLIDPSKTFPLWFSESFDLTIENELIDFIQVYLSNLSNNENNIWIVKKERGKQGMDYPITDNLSCILRHCELFSRIVSKYILNPCLLQKKKFDLRYHIIINSLEPLIIYRHELFLIRLANIEYSCNNYEEYQKHFTVMNFLDDNELTTIRGTGTRQNLTSIEFMKLFNEDCKLQNKDITWESDIQMKIDQVIKELFQYVQLTYKSQESLILDQKFHPNAGISIFKCKSIVYFFL